MIATVDAVNGTAHLDRQPESVKQAALADRIVVTKADLADAAQMAALEARLARLNPSARRWRSANAPPPAGLLLQEDAFEGSARAAEIRTWLAPAEVYSDHAHDVNRHDARIHAFTMAFDGSVDWSVFAVWFTLLLHSHGPDVLRVKGLLRVAGVQGPVVVNAAQHLVHPPAHLETWPEEWRQSRLMFIVRDLARVDLERSFAAFQSLLGAAAMTV